jgi:hypothetical protein
MARGIPKGTEAGSPESKQLDGNVRYVSQAIAWAIQHYSISGAPYFESGHKTLTKSRNPELVASRALPELSSKGVSLGCIPDGGMWFSGPRTHKHRRLLAIFEAKHQGVRGNAHERWSENYLFSQAVTPGARYHTFMTGAGANKGEILDRHSSSMRGIGLNADFYLKPEGFTQRELFDIMIKALGLENKLTFSQVKPFIQIPTSKKRKNKS